MKSYTSFIKFFEQYKLSNKRLFLVIQHYFGISSGRVFQIFKHFGFALDTRCFSLEEQVWLQLKDYISESFGDRSLIIRRERRNIALVREIKTYRGLMHSLFLPTRGQRTHTNAQTQKNKRPGRHKMSYRRV